VLSFDTSIIHGAQVVANFDEFKVAKTWQNTICHYLAGGNVAVFTEKQSTFFLRANNSPHAKNI